MGLHLDLNAFFCLVDESRFIHAIGPDGQKQILHSDGDYPVQKNEYTWPRAPYIQILLKKAIEFNEMLKENSTLTQAALAQKVGLSRVQVTQILGLLRLAPEIQQHILSLTPSNSYFPIPKHQLMNLARIPCAKTQSDEFRRLVSG